MKKAIIIFLTIILAAGMLTLSGCDEDTGSKKTDTEKLAIAKNHLIPKQRRNTGLKEEQISFTDDALKMIAAGATRLGCSAGVAIVEALKARGTTD